ncbi:MAG: hypothetical protein IH897_02585, partial [Planctomycetes bacterium]|nr:hypothetical protein [Planctomycetota bacterium]
KAPKPFGDDSIELFRAAGSRNEISEVMRRIAADNLPADQVDDEPGGEYERAEDVGQQEGKGDREAEGHAGDDAAKPPVPPVAP